MKRECGDCQLCCKLLPVEGIGKLGGHRCKHQKHGVGCAIYKHLPSIAPECRLWNCKWIVNDSGDLKRPDHSHIVIDVMPDFISVPHDGQMVDIPAVQVWIDPKHKDAYRDPALRDYLNKRGEQDGAVAIIRYSPNEGFVLFPPSLTGGEWVENHTPPVERTHTAREVIDAIGCG